LILGAVGEPVRRLRLTPQRGVRHLVRHIKARAARIRAAKKGKSDL
jgi:hypothetical protein